MASPPVPKRRPSRKPRADPLALRLLGRQEEERRRIARLLHDDLGQTLTAAVLEVEYARGAPGDAGGVIDGVVAELRRLLADARDLSLSLRPALIDEAGLPGAFGALASRVAAVRGAEVDLGCALDGARIPALVGLCAFRTAQDALLDLAAPGAHLVLRAVSDGALLRIEVRGPAAAGDPARADAIDDRVAAVGGRVVRRQRAGMAALVACLPLAEPLR